MHLPTLSDRLLLVTKIGEIVISTSKTSTSRSIRASSFATRSWCVTEVIISSMVTASIPGNGWKWCTIGVLLSYGWKTIVAQGSNGPVFKIIIK